MEQAPSKTSDITHLTRHKQNERHYAKPQAKPSFRLQDCSWARLLRASRTHKNQRSLLANSPAWKWDFPDRGFLPLSRYAPLCWAPRSFSLTSLCLHSSSPTRLAPLLVQGALWPLTRIFPLSFTQLIALLSVCCAILLQKLTYEYEYEQTARLEHKHLMGKKSDSALTPHSEQATAPRTPFRIRGSSGTQEFNNHTSDHDHQERPPTLPLSLY